MLWAIYELMENPALVIKILSASVVRSSVFSVFGRSGPTPYRSTVGPGFYHLNFGRSFGPSVFRK